MTLQHPQHVTRWKADVFLMHACMPRERSAASRFKI
jgi:hypothetical protein